MASGPFTVYYPACKEEMPHSFWHGSRLNLATRAAVKLHVLDCTLTVLAHSKWRQRCCGHTWLPSIGLFILLHVLLSTVYSVDKKENNKYNFFIIVVVYNLKSDAAVCMIHGLKKKSARVVACS